MASEEAFLNNELAEAPMIFPICRFGQRVLLIALVYRYQSEFKKMLIWSSMASALPC